ncbi:MAG TPA: YciI family protein [Solirubrobacteraceae bacterium]|nr:YciI family protein [Solirubrobacteraceae bacterium]
MPSYLLSFRTPADYRSTADTQVAWNAFFQAISTHLQDIGNPIFNRQAIGATGPDTVLGGYTVINADTLEQARELAAGCPLGELGGGVEIGELTPVSETAVP